jgi:pimeloyl-ACP methyl ester carboxylesterase
MSQRIEVETDISDLDGLPGRFRTVSSVIVPEPNRLGTRPVVAFAFPGAGYSRGYFLFDMPGSTHGGQAGYHVSNHGWIFVTCDHLGVGDSGVDRPAELAIETVATANQRTVDHVMASLVNGSLTPDCPPIDDPFVIGIGQSMGGCLTIFLQGRSPIFDAVAILGFSAIHTVTPAPEGGGPAFDPDSAGKIDPAIVLSALRYAFHYGDVPREIVDADLSDYPRRGGVVPEWASPTIPGCVGIMTSPGAVANEASEIDVPVFVGAGEIDVLPDPRAEPTAYTSTPDITVFIVPRMAHMHNFASTRTQLWDRLAAWADGARTCARSTSP